MSTSAVWKHLTSGQFSTCMSEIYVLENNVLGQAASMWEGWFKASHAFEKETLVAVTPHHHQSQHDGELKKSIIEDDSIFQKLNSHTTVHLQVYIEAWLLLRNSVLVHSSIFIKPHKGMQLTRRISDTVICTIEDTVDNILWYSRLERRKGS